MGGGGAERQVSYLYKHSLVESINILQNDCSYEIAKEDLQPLFSDHFKLGNFGILKTLFWGPLLFSFTFKENEKVLSFLELSNFVNILSKVFKSHDAYVSVRISPHFYNNKRLGFLYKFLMKFLYPYANKIITNSEQCRLDLLELIGVEESRIIVIKNALDLNRIVKLNVLSLNHDNLDNGQDFVTIGRLSYQKNYTALLKIFSLLKEKKSNSRLLIIGDGEKREELMSYAKELGLKVCERRDDKGDVYFLGFQENPYQFISKESIFLLTSHFEGLPNVLLEAMACNAFVVASDCKTGPREILTNESLGNVLVDSSILGKNGLLLPVPTDLEKEQFWVNQILNILENKEILEKIKSQALAASSHYSIENIMNKWEKTVL